MKSNTRNITENVKKKRIRSIYKRYLIRFIIIKYINNKVNAKFY